MTMKLKKDNTTKPWKNKKVLRIKNFMQGSKKRINAEFYESTTWRAVSKAYRAKYPICENCAYWGRLTPSSVTDHIITIRAGGSKLSERNLMALCDAKTGGKCHDRKRGLEGKGVTIKAVENSEGFLVPANRQDVFKLLK